jgi:type II secretory pathway pseudopilin PulG
MSRARGITLLETVVCVVLASLAAVAVLPALGKMRASALTAAGARHLAVTLQALRWKSVAQGRGFGLYFVRDASGWCWYEVRDGNGNGLRAAEIANGSDPTLSGPRRLENVASGVTLGFPPGSPIPRVPPSEGWIHDLDDPIRIGRSKLLAFSPSGTSSSGSLYVTDGRERLYAVVLYGRTAKIRVWRYAPASRQWNS